MGEESVVGEWSRVGMRRGRDSRKDVFKGYLIEAHFELAIVWGPRYPWGAATKWTTQISKNTSSKSSFKSDILGLIFIKKDASIFYF